MNRESFEFRRKAKQPRGIPRGCTIDNGADNGVRTRDPHLGKVVLYQLSHVRMLSCQSRMEATPGFEPGVKALQASALPLGHVAIFKLAVM